MSAEGALTADIYPSQGPSPKHPNNLCCCAKGILLVLSLMAGLISLFALHFGSNSFNLFFRFYFQK